MTRLSSLLKGAGALAGAAMLAVAVDATIVEPYRMTVSEVSLPEGPLSAALGAVRIAHLSDLHVKGMGLRERRLLSALEARKPDLILMTGDYADTDEGVRALHDIFSRLSPRLGIVAVPGNNDYYRGRPGSIFEALESTGVKLLQNDAVTLEGDGGRFVVAGVDDPFFGRDDIRTTMDRIPPGLPVILLAHSPAVLMTRSEGMLFNAGDADGPWGAGWFWTDGSHFRDPLPPIRFDTSGPHTLRIQRREDGAGVGRIRLVPGHEAAGSPQRGLQGTGKMPPEIGPEVIEIDPCAAAGDRLSGSWQRESREGGGCYLADLPDKGDLESYPVPDPQDKADLTFDAPEGVTYRVWVEIHSPTTSGLSDSFYLQWGDAADDTGRRRYAIGSVTPPGTGRPFDLVLAGHTHGGQVRIPGFGPLERMLTKGPYVMGRYEVDGTMIYVSRGIGTSYLPIRFACAPEIVLLSPPGAPLS